MDENEVEIWQTIPEFPEYEASNFGQIRRSLSSDLWSSGRMLKYSHQNSGYLCVILRKDKKSYCRTIHNLVAQTFLGPRPNKHDINHKDGNKENNRIDNLEYCTKSYNSWHKEENDLGTRGEKNGMHKLSKEEVLKIREEHIDKKIPQKQLSKKYKVSPATIHRAIKGICWNWLK